LQEALAVCDRLVDIFGQAYKNELVLKAFKETGQIHQSALTAARKRFDELYASSFASVSNALAEVRRVVPSKMCSGLPMEFVDLLDQMHGSASHLPFAFSGDSDSNPQDVVISLTSNGDVNMLS
jgi:hypothetical protein